MAICMQRRCEQRLAHVTYARKYLAQGLLQETQSVPIRAAGCPVAGGGLRKNAQLDTPQHLQRRDEWLKACEFFLLSVPRYLN